MHEESRPVVHGPRAARVPPRSGGARTVAVVAALVLLTAAVFAVQAALAAWGAASSSWVVEAARWADGRDARGRVPTIAGVVCLALGVVALVAVLRRRRRVSVLLHTPALYLERQDVARLASRAAAEVGGVLDASSSASDTRVVVHVTALDPSGLRADVERAVVAHLAGLTSVPEVRVHTGRRDASRGRRRRTVLLEPDGRAEVGR